MSNTDIIPGMTEVMDYIKKQEEEIKDLNNRLMTCKMSIAIRDTEINELKKHNEEIKEQGWSELTKNMETETKPKKKKIKKKILKKKKEFDYGESDDWCWGYGHQAGCYEYVIHISGGGDGVSPHGFEDWVIKKVGGELKYYIRHGGDIPDALQQDKQLWSCPEGNYVSWQDKDYEPREGEMNFHWLEEELEEEEDEDDN